jgi:subtilisin
MLIIIQKLDSCLSIFMLIMFTSTLIGSISVDYVFSQSIEQSSPEGKKITSQSPTIDVVPGQPIQILNNSFIVELKPVEVGTLEDSVSTLTSNITSYGGKVSDIYENSNSFNIKFEETSDVRESEEGGNVSLSGAEQFLQRLKDDPRVANVYPDAIVTTQAQILPNDQNRVDADLSSAKSGDGTGTVNANIAIVDTGVLKSHSDLNVYKCFSFIDNPTSGTPLNTCNDGAGHGTHVAGTAAALDNNNGVVGKAPGAKIWAIKVLNDSGSGTFSDILEALNYIASHANEIDVVNLSLGGQGTFPPVENAITNLVNNKGVVVVVAAGNSNSDANNFTPARTPAAITVSAISDSNGKCGGGGPATSRGSDDSFATYSNHGSVVDIAAPGTDVFSTYKDGNYATMSGTSMASPNVAGAAALYISMHPSATPDQVDTALKKMGTKVPHSGNGLVPCDQKGKGYFTFNDDDDQFREPLLYMKKIK